MIGIPVRPATLGVALAALLAAGPASSATLDWSGAIEILVEDLGGATYSGAMVGDPFAGQHVVPDVCGGTCTVDNEPGETNYVFSDGTGFVTDGMTQVNGVEASVNIQNDVVLDAVEAALVSQLTGQVISAGEVVDVWTGASEAAGGSIEWEVVYLALDESLYDDTSYRPTPPARGDVDLVAFQVSEFAVMGTEVFSALPEPGAASALLALLAGLAAVGRRTPSRR